MGYEERPVILRRGMEMLCVHTYPMGSSTLVMGRFARPAARPFPHATVRMRHGRTFSSAAIRATSFDIGAPLGTRLQQSGQKMQDMSAAVMTATQRTDPPSSAHSLLGKATRWVKARGRPLARIGDDSYDIR